MKYLLITYLFIFGASALSAQKICGQLIQNKSQKAQAYFEKIILMADDEMIDSATTKKGKFKFENLQKGKEYKIKYKSIFNEDLYSPVLINKNKTKVNLIYDELLPESAGKLNLLDSLTVNDSLVVFVFVNTGEFSTLYESMIITKENSELYFQLLQLKYDKNLGRNLDKFSKKDVYSYLQSVTALSSKEKLSEDQIFQLRKYLNEIYFSEHGITSNFPSKFLIYSTSEKKITYKITIPILYKYLNLKSKLNICK